MKYAFPSYSNVHLSKTKTLDFLTYFDTIKALFSWFCTFTLRVEDSGEKIPELSIEATLNCTLAPITSLHGSHELYNSMDFL